MSLEAITKIRAVEEDMERSKADAKAQAQKLIADADREGRSLLQQGREKASAAAAAAKARLTELAGENAPALVVMGADGIRTALNS